jgi:hypothetical protein
LRLQREIVFSRAVSERSGHQTILTQALTLICQISPTIPYCQSREDGQESATFRDSLGRVLGVLHEESFSSAI